MTTPSVASPFKWRTILGLIFVYLAVWFNWNWAWGVLLLLWVIPDIKSGITYFMEPISKEENPFLYWFIIISWLLMGLYSLASVFVPELGY